MIASMTHLMKNMSCVERLREYVEYDIHEKDWDKPKAPENWPKSGDIEFRDVELRYRKNLPLVLRGVNFEASDGEKVGIVGRTGSGKSTALLSLMRIVEMDDNNERSEILIDGINIRKIGLHELRRNLVIIPQDPFLLKAL